MRRLKCRRAWNFFEILHPDDVGVVQRMLTEHLEGRSPVKQNEVRLRVRSGDYRWFYDRGKVVARDASGAPTRMVGTITDITERKQAEETVVHSLASLRATLESTADGILTISADRRIESFNRPFVDMWQVPPDLLATANDDRVLENVMGLVADPATFIERVRYLYDHPMEESFERIELRDGRIFERFSRPRLVAGEPTGRVWSFRDVTARQRAETRLAAFAKLGRELSAIHRDETAAHTILTIADQLFSWDSCTLRSLRCRDRSVRLTALYGRDRRPAPNLCAGLPRPAAFAADTAGNRAGCVVDPAGGKLAADPGRYHVWRYQPAVGVAHDRAPAGRDQGRGRAFNPELPAPGIFSGGLGNPAGTWRLLCCGVLAHPRHPCAGLERGAATPRLGKRCHRRHAADRRLRASHRGQRSVLPDGR